MTIKNVTVVEVEKVKAGKTDRIVLHYVGSDKTTWKIGALAVKLDEDSRKKLLNAKKDDVVSIEMIKDGNYWNLTKVGDALTAAVDTASPASGSTYQKKPTFQAPATSGGYVKSKETDTRIQVMNALTNAVVSLGSGHTPSEYKERVLEFVLLGNNVVDTVLSGNLEALAVGASDIVGDDETDDDIGF